MKKSYDRIGDFRIYGRLAIPEGIITTNPTVMLKFAKESVAGIIFSKSIGPKPRKGKPAPVLNPFSPTMLINSVSLANPGIEAYLDEMIPIREEWPEKKFLATQIFPGDAKTGDVAYGDSKQDLVYVAKLAKKVSDGIDLNFGCPHSGGLAQIGGNPGLVHELTAAVVDAVDIPVLVKLPPTDKIAYVAKVAVHAGAAGVIAINTVGPETTNLLYSRKGGLSGPGIRETGILCVSQVANAVDVPLIGMGGISDVETALAYISAGADFIGFGSALYRKTTPAVIKHLRILNNAIKNPKGYRLPTIPDFWDKPLELQIENVEKVSDDLRILTLDYALETPVPGQFMMLQPEGGEAKPFSIADNNPLTFAVKRVGETTSKMCKLKEGDNLSAYGPFGKMLEPKDFEIRPVVLVSGGTGTAFNNMVAKALYGLDMIPTSFIGARTKKELILLDRLSQYSNVVSSTDDGSAGRKSTVVDLLEFNLKHINKTKSATFVNCGPEPMIKKAFEIEKKYVNNAKIFCAIERMTKCGVGLCGSCEINGFRACVDGPAFEFQNIEDALGVYKRDATGARVIM